MSFFARVFNHLVNEVLVNSLANSRAFQRFAVRSNEWFTEMAKKSAAQQKEIGEKAQTFQKEFREQLRKGMDELQQDQMKKK